MKVLHIKITGSQITLSSAVAYAMSGRSFSTPEGNGNQHHQNPLSSAYLRGCFRPQHSTKCEQCISQVCTYTTYKRDSKENAEADLVIYQTSRSLVCQESCYIPCIIRHGEQACQEADTNSNSMHSCTGSLTGHGFFITSSPDDASVPIFCWNRKMKNDDIKKDFLEPFFMAHLIQNLVPHMPNRLSVPLSLSQLMGTRIVLIQIYTMVVRGIIRQWFSGVTSLMPFLLLSTPSLIYERCQFMVSLQ
jgi:hypothetical protein